MNTRRLAHQCEHHHANGTSIPSKAYHHADHLPTYLHDSDIVLSEPHSIPPINACQHSNSSSDGEREGHDRAGLLADAPPPAPTSTDEESGPISHGSSAMAPRLYTAGDPAIPVGGAVAAPEVRHGVARGRRAGGGAAGTKPPGESGPPAGEVAPAIPSAPVGGDEVLAQIRPP